MSGGESFNFATSHLESMSQVETFEFLNLHINQFLVQQRQSSAARIDSRFLF